MQKCIVAKWSLHVQLQYSPPLHPKSEKMSSLTTDCEMRDTWKVAAVHMQDPYFSAGKTWKLHAAKQFLFYVNKNKMTL